MKWVPDKTSNFENLDKLIDLFKHLNPTVLTGAGCSTESGIPDYRGPKSKDTHPEPILYRDFTESEAIRRRYWARAMIGWPKFNRAEPNHAHRSIAKLEQHGLIEGIITQNVDDLHRKAGSESVIKLHGSLSQVRCLSCHNVIKRKSIQEWLNQKNPHWKNNVAELRPDGDAAISGRVSEDFKFPDCNHCAGILKPDVVFFGENVPSQTKQKAWSMLRRSDSLLVIGSSLSVRSSYQFVEYASKRRLPIGIINLGSTRVDDKAWLRVEAKAGDAVAAFLQGILSSHR